MRKHFFPVLASLIVLSACAKPQTPASLSVDRSSVIAGSALLSVSEPDPRMRRIAPQARVTPVTLNPLVLVAAVAITAATSAAVAATSPANDFPAPGARIGDEAEAEAAKIVAEALQMTASAEASLADASRAFQPTEEGDAALLQTAKARAADGLALNVRLNEHAVRPSKTRNDPDNAWIYALDMSARLTDLRTGEVMAKATCKREENLRNVPLFKIASLGHAGGDAAAASAAWEAYKRDLLAAQQSQEAAKNDLVGVGATGDELPEDPTASFSTPEQDAVYMDHLARAAALNCARQMSVSLIGATGS